MSLLDRVFQRLRRAQPDEAVPVKTTSEEMPAPPAMPSDLLGRLTAERERAAVVRKCNEMYETDPRCEAAIDTLARDIVKGGFVVKAPDRPEAEDAAAALYERLDVGSSIDDWVRETLIEGDSLLESGVDAGGLIQKVTRKPTLKMHRNSNRADEFDDPARAFWYADEAFAGLEPPRDALWFAQWQIVHARWNHRSKSRYGRPLFASATGAWKKMKEGELDIAIRRKTRAGMKFLHVVEGGDEGAVKKYRAENKDALNNPFAAVADYFSNKPGSITAIQGDARLAEIGDVVHHIETWWTVSPVPMALVGYGKDLNRDILEQKQRQYDRALEQLTQWCEDEIVKPLVHLQWLLLGILPEGLSYEIEWKSKAPASAADIRDVSDAAIRLKALGWPAEVVNSIVARFLPWVDLEVVMAATQKGDSAAADDAAVAARLGGLVA
jgi:hypothetical protein